MFGIFGSSFPPSPRTNSVAFGEKEHEDPQPAFNSKKLYKISTCLFGNRHCPAYLDHTSFEGSRSSQSVRHWLEVLALWESGEGIFFPINVKPEHMERIKVVLTEYLSILERYEEKRTLFEESKGASGICREEAKILLKQIEEGIAAQKPFYIPLGYPGGIDHKGHMITTKFKFYGKKIEILFLNLGEGAQMHPYLSWSETSPRFHFQSFPTLVDPEILFGPEGAHVFTRLIRIYLEECSPHVQGYDATDIYGAMWLLGYVQSSFDSKPEARAKKSQIDSNCDDMAITLLLMDLLIDLGYQKREIQRFFCNELFSNLISYSQQLNDKTEFQDEWLLLCAALEDFTVHLLHLCGNSLEEWEVVACKKILESIFEQAHTHLKGLYPASDPISFEFGEGSLFKMPLKDVTFKKKDIGGIQYTAPETATDRSEVPPIFLPPAEQFVERLQEWSKVASGLNQIGQSERGRQFVYRAMLSLPIPDPDTSGYWDELPAQDRVTVLENLAAFACLGVKTGRCNYPAYYKYIFLLHVGYAITDKLARLNGEMRLTGFASPFFPTKTNIEHFGRLKQFFKIKHFEFALLPREPLNGKWRAILHYFQTQASFSSKNILFALTEGKIDIQKGIDEMTREHTFHKPSLTVEHLHYLKQFLPEQLNRQALASDLAALWTNENGKLPVEYDYLYFFAYYCWAFFTAGDQLIFPPAQKEAFRIARKAEEKDFILLPIKGTLRVALYEEEMPTLGIGNCRSDGILALMFKNQARKSSENECICNEVKNSEYASCLMTEKNYRIWCRIFATPSLQITSTIDWIERSVADAKFWIYHPFIEMALLEPGMLQQKIGEEPQTLPNLRRVLEKAIDFCNTSHPNVTALIFFIRLAICVETFDQKPQLASLEELLLNAVSRVNNPWPFYAALLLLYQMDLPRNMDSLRELIKGQFWIQFFAKNNKECAWGDLEINRFPHAEHWMWQEIPFTTDYYASLLREAFQDPQWLQKLAEELLTLLGIEQNEKYTIEADFPKLSIGNVLFDVEQTTCIREQREHLLSIEYDRSHQLIWMVHNICLTFDGKTKFEKEGKEVTLSKKFNPFNEEEEWFTEIQSEDKQPILSHALLRNNKIWWKKCSDPVFLITHEDRPLYFISEEGVVQKLTGKEPLYLLSWQESPSLSHFFQSLGSHFEVCCWAKPGTFQIAQLDFLDLGLSFKGEEIEGKWRLRSVQFPQHFLITDSTLKELNHFRGAILLENGRGCEVVLPKRVLKKVDRDFTSEASLTNKDIAPGFFLYHFDSHAQLLVSEDPLANLFLTLLFAMQRDYQKALLYLPRATSFKYCKNNTEMEKLIEQFKDLKEHSPEALAFYLRFGLYFIESGHQLLKEGFNRPAPKREEKQDIEEKIFIWLGEVYEKYLRALSTKEESKIPGDIRLTYTEEALFLTRLKPHLEAAGKIYWKSIFQIREQLLSQPEGYYHFTIPIKEYSSSLNEYQMIPLISLDSLLGKQKPDFCKQAKELPDFVRLSDKRVGDYFIALYEEGVQEKNIQADLNILFLLRSNDYLTKAYAALLLYVHTYPNKFRDLQFGIDPKENLIVFDTILQRATSLSAVASQVGSLLSRAWKKSLFFYYQTSGQLQLPFPPQLKPLPWDFSTATVQNLKRLRNSLYSYFLQKGLEAEKVSLGEERPFAYASLQPISLSPTEKGLVADLQEGHTKLFSVKGGKTYFQLTIPQDEFLDLAREHLKNLKKQLRQIKKSAEKKANAYPDIDFRIALRKRARDLPKLTMEGILSEAYEKTDPMVIRRANPTLGPSKVYSILKKTIEYHLLIIQVYQLENGITQLEKEQNIQAFGEAIANYDRTDPTQEPEIILFQSRTRKILKKKQIKLLEWQCASDAKFSLFTAPAGGGKTTIFQPILMKREARKGAFPVSVSPKPLYQVDREGLRFSARHAHGFGISVLEASLEIEMKEADFKKIYEELLHYSDKKGLKITPEVYYTLQLKYQLLLDTGTDLESIRWVSLILDLFKKKVTSLIDESRLNLSPFTQAKIGIGLPQALPLLDRKVFLAIYSALVSDAIFLADGRSVANVVQLTRNLQATLSPADLELVKTAVLKSLITHPLFAIPDHKEYQKEILLYWQGEGEEPAWIDRLQEDQKKAIDIVAIYFDLFFSPSMKLVGKIKHICSLKRSEEIHVPARKRQATGAYFEQAHVTLITTIHGVLQEGLKAQQIYTLLELLYEEHYKETGSSGDFSESESLFHQWMEDKTLRLKDFVYVWWNEKIRDTLVSKLAHNRDAILWYLERYLSQQVTYSPEYLVVTPSHFLTAFHKSILFSADPGPSEIYGLYKRNAIKRDHTFSAQVLSRMSAPENEQILTFPLFTRPLDLFRWLLANNPRIYKSLTMLADGGMLRDFTTKEIANDFFIFIDESGLPYDGVIQFEDSEKKESEGELLLHLKTWKHPKILKGHAVEESIAALGFNWEELNLLTLIDPSHTTGANIKQKPDSCALVLLAEEFSLGEGKQTVMRMRDFLVNQTVVWGILSFLRAQIESTMEHELTPEILRCWMLKNEGARIDKEIPLSAFQQIAYAVGKRAWDEIDKYLDNPAKQVAIWRRYRKGFVKKTECDLIKRFKEKPRTQAARATLLGFAEKSYHCFGYSTKWKDATAVREMIEPVIRGVEKHTPLLSTRSSHDLMQQTHMHVAQTQEIDTDKIQTFYSHLVPESILPLRDLSIESPNFLKEMVSYCRTAQAVFGRGMTEELYFTHNALNTAISGLNRLKETYLKPVQYILCVLTCEKWVAFALSDYEADYFQKDLLKQGMIRKAALLSSQGNLVQNGTGKCALSEKELASEFICDVLIDVGLTQCELYNPERFIERLENWGDFWPMWERIKSWQTLPQEIHVASIERLVPSSLKSVKEKVKEPEKKKGFFSWFM